MITYKGIVTLIFIPLFIEFSHGNMLYNLINREDPCVTLCEKTPLSFTNTQYVKSCCQRGCRFFNLVDLNSGLEGNGLNGTREACEASCTEAYTKPQDRYACSTGCEFMAKQRVLDLLSLISVAIYEEEGLDSSILFMSDIPENDLLTDPGLRKELLPRWWDYNGFKLPQTYIKTVPIDIGTMDYGIPSDYAGDTEQSASVPGSDWLQCASRHTGIPQWILALAIVGGALSALWLYLSPDKPYVSSNEIAAEKPNIGSTKVTLFVPDEAPLHKVPPPGYAEAMGIPDIKFKS